MAIADKILVILGFASALYGAALLAAWTIPSLTRLRVLAPPFWRSERASRHFVIVRAAYLATFGLFIGCQAIGQYLLAVIFAVPAIIFAGIAIEQSLRKSGPRTDA